MEFRNHQNWVRYRVGNLNQNPLAAILFVALFLALLVPLVAIALLGVAIFVVTLPIRLLIERLRVRNGTPGPLSNAAPTPPNTPSGATGPVIDVEVTRSESR